MPLPYRMSFQLYTARAVASQEAVLAGLAEMGYDAIEAWPADYLASPRSFRRRLDEAGLECLGFHMPFLGIVEEPERFIGIAGTLGARPLMIPSFLPAHLRPSDVDGWKEIGMRLGKGVETARAAGFRVAWHNHEFEFRLLPDGSRPIDHMLGEAGDDLGLEIDFAWVKRGWADPEAELRRFATRIVAIQLKDTAPAGTLDEENGWRATGDGIIDWDRLWPLFAETGADHLVVEHDRPRDWRTVAARSLDFARSYETGAVA